MYIPLKYERVIKSIKEVKTIIEGFNKWNEYDVKYNDVDGYYYPWVCPVCNVNQDNGLSLKWKNKVEIRWTTCPACGSRFGLVEHWYTDNKVRVKINPYSEDTVLNIKVAESGDSDDDNEWWPVYVKQVLQDLKREGLTFDHLIEYYRYQGKLIE